MTAALLTRDEVGRLGEALYEGRIRAEVETLENLGKMVIIDIETGDFAIDALGIDSAHQLQEKHPGARLYGIRIGYKVSESLNGLLERRKAA